MTLKKEVSFEISGGFFIVLMVAFGTTGFLVDGCLTHQKEMKYIENGFYQNAHGEWVKDENHAEDRRD